MEDLPTDIDAVSRLSGQFVLRSGQLSSEYFDKYLFEAQPALLRRVAAAMVPLLPKDTAMVAGLELGGIPVEEQPLDDVAIEVRPVLTRNDLDVAQERTGRR